MAGTTEGYRQHPKTLDTAPVPPRKRASIRYGFRTLRAHRNESSRRIPMSHLAGSHELTACRSCRRPTGEGFCLRLGSRGSYRSLGGALYACGARRV